MYHQILTKYKKIKKQIKLVELEIKKFPEGKFICSCSKNRCKWYHNDGKKKIYIPKSNRLLAEQLATKQYLTLLLEDLSSEAMAIEFYLRHHHTSKAEKLLQNKSEYRELLMPYFKPISQELSEWTKASYEHNTKYSEQRIHKGASGNMVRSKSEAMIDTFLYKNKIPFRYECALTLGSVTMFPDFTICHPRTGELYYWEHFGMMDNPVYSKNAFDKLELYTANGIIPSIQLITTYETKEHPLSVETIENIIEAYFR